MQYLQIINLVSLYGIVFFAFLAVAMVREPAYLPFKGSDEQVNSCCIVFMLYMAVFLLTCCLQKGGKQQEQPQLLPKQHSQQRFEEEGGENELRQNEEIEIEQY